MTDVDVVVIGSGLAGLCAAITAAEAGTSVVVAESESEVGGSSRLSAGMLMGAGTRFQRAAGIEDSPEQLFHEYMQLNRWDVDAGLVDRLTRESGPAIEWLADLGVTFYDEISFCGDESRPRMHLPRELGAGVIEVLRRRAVELGVEIVLGQRVDRLLVTDGATRGVRGVAVGDDELTAPSVVVASGGFGANPAKLAEWFPLAARSGDWCWYMGSPSARGDALDLAEQVDAQIAGAGRGLCLLHPNFVREYEPYLPGWLVLVDGDGRRFCNETAPYGLLADLVAARGGRAFAIFDVEAKVAAPADKAAAYKQTNPAMPGRRSPNWNDEMIDRMVAAGQVATGATVGELADRLGLPADVLARTTERYCELAAAGDDTDHLKDPRFLRPIQTPPFYGVEVRLATVALTSAGLRIDRDAAVLDRVGRPIPGLFAAGECTGGVLGEVYMGSGNSYSNCLVYGRIAGQSAARIAGESAARIAGTSP
jgi:fumarate reductase flavoprotein subunit